MTERPDLNLVELREDFERSKRMFELECDIINLNAKKYKVSFDSLVEEGFLDDQALEIMKARGPSIF